MAFRFFIVVLIGGVVACGQDRESTEPDPIRRPVVERLSERTVRIRWPTRLAWGAVTIYAGRTPETIDRTRPLAVVHGNAVRLTGTDDYPWVGNDYRLYYELVPASGDPPVITAERRLPLQGPDNFRDLGGYRTVDGRTVRWGQLYRSNDLSGLTRDDQAYLARLGIRLVCDLRSERERIRKPDADLGPASLPEGEATGGPPVWQYLPVDQEGVDPWQMQYMIRTGGIAALGIPRLMRTAYESFVTVHSSQWADMLGRIAQPGSLPTLIHCTAGKDRPGYAAALILLSLGVPEDTVFEDYLLTNHYRRNFYRLVMRWVPVYSMFRTNPEDVLPLLEARPEYLRTSHDAIVEVHGSVDAYLEDALGVSPAMRQQLREQLLD